MTTQLSSSPLASGLRPTAAKRPYQGDERRETGCFRSKKQGHTPFARQVRPGSHVRLRVWDPNERHAESVQASPTHTRITPTLRQPDYRPRTVGGGSPLVVAGEPVLPRLGTAEALSRSFAGLPREMGTDSRSRAQPAVRGSPFPRSRQSRSKPLFRRDEFR